MKNTKFDDQIRNALNTIESDPSDSVWERIEGHLSADKSFDELINQKLNNIEVAPSPKLWERIEQRLNKSSNIQKFPRYIYPSVAAAIALLIVGAWIMTQQGTIPESLNTQTALLEPALLTAPQPSTQATQPQQEKRTLAAASAPSASAKPLYSSASTSRSTSLTSGRSRMNRPKSSTNITNTAARIDSTTDTSKAAEVNSARAQHHPHTDTPNKEKLNNEENKEKRDAAISKFLADGSSANSKLSDNLVTKRRRRGSDLSLAFAGNSNSVTNSFIKPGIASSLNRSPNNIRAVQLLTASQTEIAQPTSIQHQLPITASLLMQNRFSRLFALEFGLSYTLLTSELNKKGSVVLFERQSLHYVGVPVSGIFTIWENRWLQTYAKVGGAMEINVYGTHDFIISSNNNTNKYREIVTDSQFQFSAHASVGLGYNLSKNWQLSIEPGVVYYFNNHSRLITYRQEQPLNFSLTAAVKYRF